MLQGAYQTSENFLRPYQTTALNKIYSALLHRKNVLLQGMMGCGKTVMSVKLLQRLHAAGLSCLVLAHKKELVTQFRDAFLKFTDIKEQDIGICCAGLRQKTLDRRITVATVQTFVNLAESYPGAGIIIIDEAHKINVNDNSQYKQTIDALREKKPECRILGITATPYRLDHGYIYGSLCAPGNTNLFPELTHKITYDELRRAEYLVTLKGEVAIHAKLEQDLAGVAVQGDYVISQLGEIMSRTYHLRTAAEAISKFCGDYKKICVFCCTIEHADLLADLLPDAVPVHSGLTDLERLMNYDGWRSGRHRIATSVNILTEGVDIPELECLVFARPTLSPALWLQAVGRVLRICDGKDHGFLVDLTDNTSRFGTDLDAVRVHVPAGAGSAGEKSMWKLCPYCADMGVEHLCHTARRTCDRCGYEWPTTEKEEAARLPDTESVTFEKQPPEWFTVKHVEKIVHQSAKNEKLLGRLKITYDSLSYFDQSVSLWFCFDDFYNGYAVMKSRGRWSDVSDTPYPRSVDEFQNSTTGIINRVCLDTSGKYPEIMDLDVEFDELPF